MELSCLLIPLQAAGVHKLLLLKSRNDKEGLQGEGGIVGLAWIQPVNVSKIGPHYPTWHRG